MKFLTDHYQHLVNNIISFMEKGSDSWRNPFQKMEYAPFNPINSCNYNSHNLLLLMSTTKKLNHNRNLIDTEEYFSDPRWCTSYQAKNKGYKINKEAVPTSIYFYDYHHGVYYTKADRKQAIYSNSPLEFIDKTQKMISKNYNLHVNNILIDKISLKYKEEIANLIYEERIINSLANYIAEIANIISLSIEYSGAYILQRHELYNFTQLENTSPYATYYDIDKYSKIEKILQLLNVKIIHEKSNTLNYYKPSTHEIHLVPTYFFYSKSEYYASLIHELTHWTIGEGLERNFGELRLNNYELKAKEELRAELASIFICAFFGIDYDLVYHTPYINSWIKILKQQPQELFLALQDATKIADYIIKSLN